LFYVEDILSFVILIVQWSGSLETLCHFNFIRMYVCIYVCMYVCMYVLRFFSMASDGATTGRQI